MKETADLLEQLARRCEAHEWTLGAVFGRYCNVEHQTPESLASHFGCSLETLRWIAVCRRPRGDQFADDVRAVAERFNVSATKLAAIVRRVEAVDALRRPGAGDRDDEQMLLAARDRGDE
jgi:hypothetical protein